MGRIKKTASERHLATLSPFVKDFVKRATEVPLHLLPSKLATFPQNWPLPRGDLYHWIPLLDRFDHALQLFNDEYELSKGPQQEQFQRRLLEKGDTEGDGTNTAVKDSELDVLGYTAEGDRELVEAILHFTRILLEHCGNRSLYASSSHIGDLLNTTSLSVLRLCLKLSLRLAQRYQVARYKNHHASTQAVLLANHYNLNLDHLHRIAQPFPKPHVSSTSTPQTPGKGKEKQTQPSSFNPADLTALAKQSLSLNIKAEVSSVSLNYYDQPSFTSRQESATAQNEASPASPTTPTPIRRASNLGPSRDRPSAAERSTNTSDVPSTPSKIRGADSTSTAPRSYHIPAKKVAETPVWELVKEAMPNVPEDSRYDLLNRIRIAKAFASAESTCQELLEVRLLAIANLTYAYSESKFQDRIGIPDSEEPRRFHLAQQLCDLLQPATGGQQALTIQTETTVLLTLEALTKSRHKVPEVTDALAIAVNHGLLYYELRKVLATFNAEEHADAKTEFVETEWREAMFDLINGLLQSNTPARYGERMVAAGIIEILVEPLSLRTNRAERFHEKILQFFDGFIHGLPTAFQTLANAKGLDIIADLTSFEVETALRNAENGRGLPEEYKSKVVDYDIPFHQQSTLRQLFKNTVHMFEHNAGTHDRLLRNLIDTPQILGALRTVVESAHTFGSNVWSGAVNIISNFIHNEPTSYQVIGEAGLSKALLESITGQALPDEMSTSVDEPFSRQDVLRQLDPVKDGKIQYPSIDGILPVGEVMVDIPNAFGAICLNETGMQLFQASRALVRYFDIFLSPRHVRAMEDEGQTAQAIGQAFDELSRHHPRLKDQIMGAIFNMLQRLRQLFNELAEYEQAGAKLWERSNGALSVAGGRAALKGATSDDYDNALHHAAAFAPASQTEPLPDNGEDSRERAPTINYLNACFKFLEGFFRNNTMCSLFTDESGAEIVLDLVTSPSNPHDLASFPIFLRMSNVLKNMCEAKPHLVLPSLIRRTQFALLGLKDLTSNDSPQSSFLAFTDLSTDTKPSFANGLDGTSVVKSMANINILTHVLGRTLSPPPYGLRHTNHQNPHFNTLNFTDIYMDLVDSLGKLYAACVWENLMLQRDLSQEVQQQTDPRTLVMRRVGLDDVVDIPVERERLQEPAANTASDVNDDVKKPDPGDRVAVLEIKNSGALRYLLLGVPMGIDTFFSSLGQAIITKRSESGAKQHAGLIADRLAQSVIWQLDYRRNRPDEKILETRYVGQILACISRIMLRNSYSMEAIGTTKEALTLVLNKFYIAGGFTKLNEYLERFAVMFENRTDGDQTEITSVREALAIILFFYGQVVRSKCISDANQSNVIRVIEPTSPDFFLPGQFLVELRYAVLPAVCRLWQSQSIDKFSDGSIKCIVEALRVILKGEGEDRALRRAANASRRVAISRPEFSLRNEEGLEQVIGMGYETSLAREAVYRCNNSPYNAEQYCRLRQRDSRVPRFPIPEGETTANTEAASDEPMAERGSNAADTAESDSTRQDSSRMDAEGEGPGLLAPTGDATPEDENMGSLGALPAELQREDLRAMMDPDDYAMMTSGRGGPGSFSRVRARDTQQMFITVDDLDEKRKEVRDDLIDRCLDVLSSHRNVTFELADLIQAAVAKSGDAIAPRADIGTTLVSGLMSLQGEEPGRESGLKIHAYAHLVALILQERDFFDSMLDELKECFDNLVGWVQLDQDQKIEEAPWVETVLLIIERVLAEDEQPPNIEWAPPPVDDPLKLLPQPSPRVPVVSETQRSQLLTAMVDVLPKIGKSTTLALSVCRILVVLTRHRALAARLSERQNMGRLFLMIRQLAGSANDNKLQSSFMLILRHMIEDDNTVRQLMRAEIRAAFENPRSGRGMDTSTYCRNLHHLALRNPKIFVEVTEELLEISRYEGYPNRAQTLGLKNKANSVENAEPSSTSDPTSKADDSEPQKQSEAKLPAVESTDGVVPFLLRELSNYKDVEEKPAQVTITASPVQDPTDEAPSPDIEMRDAALTAGGAVGSNSPESKNKQQVFKPEEHAIYIYRCFLLQCLAELVACYNRTKIEFINFSRKAEVQQSTPSKPRSGTLNYLLNTLLPVGTLEHRDDINHRKKEATSNWATNVLVSLCTKTQERFLSPHSMWESGQFADQEPELTFVRKFVLEHALRAFKDATVSTEPLDLRYSRLLALGELFNRMLNGKVELQRSNSMTASNPASHQQVGRLMYERNFIGSLTSAIAELDLNFPHAKRAVKYILGPLKQLTELGVTLSQTSDLSSSSAVGTSADEDDISSATSLSDDDEEDREQTPDLFRGSSLGMFEANHGHDDEESGSGSDEDEDDEMYEDDYDGEMEYDEEPVPDHGDVVSDEDDDLDQGGEMQGFPEAVEMEIDVMTEEEDGSDEDDDDDDDDVDDEDDGGLGGIDDDDEDDGDEDHEFADQMDEITGDDENASMADHDEEGDWEDDGMAFDDNMDDHDAEVPFDDPLEQIAQVIGADVASDGDEHEHVLRDGVVRIEMENGDGEYFEDEMAQEDDEDEDEADFDADVVYEPEIEDDEDDEQHAGWTWNIPAPPAILRGGFPHHHHHHHRNFNEMLGMLGGDPLRSGFRTHRSAPNIRDEDGVNPLLQRENGSAGSVRERENPEMPFARYTARRALARDDMLQNLMAGLNAPGAAGSFNVNLDISNMANIHPLPFYLGPGRGGHAHAIIDIDSSRPLRDQIGANFMARHTDARVVHGHEEASAVDFRPNQTSNRWQEEARMLFPGKFHEKATRVTNMLLRALVPRAMEAKRIRDKEEAERKAAEEKAAEEARQKAEAEKAEREAQEKREREEREAQERAETEARAREEAERSAREEEVAAAESSDMEGVEQSTQESSTPEAQNETSTANAQPTERITINIRGNELDITTLGIDRDYLEALPEEMREEVITAQYAEQRSQAARSGEQPTEISREFLEALPQDLQRELLQSEAQDRRNRDRAEARRRAAQENNNNAPVQPEEMNNADFMAMLEPALRQAVLMEADDTVLAALPEEFQAEARALFGDRRPRGQAAAAASRLGMVLDGHRAVNNAGARADEAAREASRQRRPVIQMLDKAGVATLLRLMFVSLNNKAKTNLHGILSDVCKNTQNRAEVISILLSILQDGTADASAIERSFAQLSLRAKQPTGPKTPQAPKRGLPDQQAVPPSTDLSPLNIVQQCLGSLNALCNDNPRVPSFFLNEHETVTSQKTKTPKKGKGRESRAAKFPLNALLTLLDRKLVIENTAVMETLASLLSHVTHPLTILLRRAKEAQDADKAAAESRTEGTERPQTSTSDVPMADANVVGPPESGSSEPTGSASAGAPPKSTSSETKKKHRDLTPPEVPEENIRLVVNILAARECPSKTFSDTLDIIKNLSAIPGAKEVFGKELIRQAQELGQNLLADLEELAKQIDVAKTGTDLQGMALANFSSAGSKQRKLLRVLVALDHLFDPKRTPVVSNSGSTAVSVEQKLKENILATLYENSSFEKLWNSLSVCLTAIRRRGNMVNVATILLPLIESLMVVCRNSTPKETTSSANASSSVDTGTGTPPPSSRMEKWFFTFTEEHRKILNELIRNNPKLMNGNLSVLAKNSKVLEFDNKRNYFGRRLHDRRTEVRITQPTLQLSVRRDEVFRDSFKSLYYKSGDEIKYGKLNIRFHGEEGIDAGGVSREWFGAMARQMFDPNYALFNPVASDRTTFHPNSLSEINPEHLMFFKFIGRIIGKALYENRVLDCHFSRAVYRRILGKSVSLKDMETLDLDYYKSLVWILENDITDVTFETFSIDVDQFGVVETFDLIPNGRNIPVTEDNKHEYVRLVVEFRLIKSVQEQLDQFLVGFHEIIPAELISIFDEQELELLISGLPDIDVDDWKNNAEYHNYQATSPQIQWFWRAVRSFDQEEKAKLLQFVTGTSKVPLNGFKELEGMNGFAKFSIHRDYSNKEKLPSSHTCFNQLDLPEYESYEHLRHQLYTAITAGSEYFGFA